MSPLMKQIVHMSKFIYTVNSPYNLQKPFPPRAHVLHPPDISDPFTVQQGKSAALVRSLWDLS